MSTSSPPRPATVRSATAEQYAPVLRVHAELMAECTVDIDGERARKRIATGHPAYDALRVLRSAGNLSPKYARVLDAFEVAGFASNADLRALLDEDADVDDLIAGWFTGDRTPRHPRRGLARHAAIVVGNAVLRAASDRVGAPSL